MIEKGSISTRRDVLILGGLALGVGGLAPVAKAGAKHAPIRAAIAELKSARDYLNVASHDFGGHRAKAVRSVTDALEQLKVCLKY